MSIEVTSHIDDALWDDLVEGCAGSNIFHTRSFLEVFADSDKYRPFAFFLVENGRPRACLQTVRARLLGPSVGDLVSRSVSYGGVLCADDLTHNFIQKHLPKLIERHDEVVGPQTIYSEVRNVSDPMPVLLALTGLKHKFVPHLNYLVDLTQGEEPVWNNIVSKRRRLITKAMERGVELVEGTTDAHLETYINLVSATYARAKLPCFEPEIFRQAWKLLGPSGRFRILLTRYEGEFIGTMGTLPYNRRVFDWYAASNAQGDALDVNAVLAWANMKWGCENGYDVFDFGGAGDPNEEYGVREFKGRFRGQLVNYGRFVRVYAPVRYAVAVAGYGALRGLIFR